MKKDKKTKAIIGYVITPLDNDSVMLDDRAVPERCPLCHYIVDFDYHNPFFKLKRKTYDFSCPYDIGIITSLKFKEFCVREGYKNIQFKEFEREPNFFHFITRKILPFDAKKVKSRFGKLCPVCKNYDTLVGTDPPTLIGISKPLKDGFYSSDLCFGSYDKKNPLIIIGIETQAKLKREKFTGIDYEPIEL
ncbi:hypothetical protein [Chryseolinea lacunae]|uniref:Uncharacterized protein n=1 Tax=Chryseolinea lacunae TaxID=2801331 RepID=A0ABS1L233_9BACT|nr:hypothetical protein [Chryseolinea lacunae]MBL0745583.1 hypothetical protein [Chryseolinea lacunae]